MAAPMALGLVVVLALGGLAPLLGEDPGQVGEPATPETMIVAAPKASQPVTSAPAVGDAASGPILGQAPAPGGPVDLVSGMPVLDPADAIPWTPGDATQALAYSLAQAGDGPAVRNAVVSYLFQQGYPVAPPMQPEPPSTPHFNANDTLAFSHNVGDADGDGFEDVAINALCVTRSCTWSADVPLIPPQSIPPIQPEGPENCNQPQQLYVRSGRTGALLWDIDLSRENLNLTIDNETVINQQDLHDYIFCPVHIVMGSIPVGPQTMDLANGQLPPTGAKNGTALVVYSLGGVFGPMAPSGVFGTFGRNPILLKLEHQVYAFDSATGERLWTHTEEGTVVMWDACENGYTCGLFGTPPGGNRRDTRVVRADNLLVNPLFMVPHDDGLQVRGNATPALLLQGVSFEYDMLYVAVGPPGQTRGNHILDSYRPNEWAGSLDLNTGELKWTASTFTPVEGRSVVPSIINAVTPGVPFTFFTGYRYEARVPNPWDFVYGSGIRYEVDVIAQNYWRHDLCCYDITGDGVPDLVYTTQEWNPTPMNNEAGPYYLDSRIVAFDGTNGAPIWEQWIAQDTPRFTQDEYDTLDAFAAHLEIVGDADGDGLDDFIVNKYYLAEDFLHEAEVHSGADGSLIWGVRSGQHKLILPIGDSDGDGAIDVAMFDWFDWDYPAVKFYDLANVTAHPIKVRSGTDGHVLWETRTFSAPLDLYYIVDGYKVSGLNDLNGDGVGDFSVDDPTMLPDQTVVHELRFLSGTNGKPIYSRHTVGTFAFPIWAGDQDMDGIDEFLVFSGEISDIWITNYDGRSGQPLWSQRFISMNANDYTLAVPRIAVLGLDSEAGEAPLINYQMRIQRYGGFIFNEATYPQIRSFHPDGVRGWNYPVLSEPQLYEPVLGATPAATLVKDALKEQSQSALVTMYADYDRPIWKGVMPSIGAFLLMFLSAFKLADIRRTRRRARIGRNAEW